MDDILASIRKILDEEGTKPQPGAVAPHGGPPHAELAQAIPHPDADPVHEPDVLELEPHMMLPDPDETAPGPVPGPPPIMADPAPAPAPLVAPAAAAAAALSVGTLMRTLAQERTTAVHRGGPTIEDLVRDEMRPLLKEWLDQHLPSMVERLVRAEIERVVNR